MIVAISVNKILDDLRSVPDFKTFEKIKSYVRDHISDYSTHDYDILEENIDEIEAKRFSPMDCSQIRNIYYLTKSGYTSKEWTPLGQDYSISICATAVELGIPLKQYLFDMFPDMETFKIDHARPSEYERSMLREIFPTMEERRERKFATRQPAPTEGEIPMGIDVADLLEKQRSEMAELIEAARYENHAEMERLRENINSLKAKLESAARPMEEKEISRVLDSSQYNYFQRNIVTLGLPVKQRRIARGEYEVSIIVTNPDEEKNALGFMADVEEHSVVRESRRKIRPVGFDKVVDILCSNYEKHANMSCGLSRTGALSTLAERLIEYAASQGTEWDKMFDLYSLDLFAKKGKIYTREQADEAFNNAVRQIEGKSVSARLEREEAEECDIDTLSNYVIEYDAIGVIESKKMIPEIPERLIDLRDNAIREMSKCGYYPNKLDELRENKDVEFSSMGTSYNEQLSAQVDDYVRRYG